MAHIIFPKRGFTKALRSTVDQGHPLAQNMVCCYPCNEGGGLVIHNVARPYGDLAINGTTTWANRQPDAGFSVDANNSGAVVTAPAAAKPAKTVSVFWYGVILSNGSLGNNPMFHGVTFNNSNTTPFNSAALARVNGDTTGVYCLWNSDAGTARNFSTTGILSTGVAVSLLMVHDGGVPLVSFYANGVLKNSNATANTIVYDATACVQINRHITSATDNVGAHCLMAGIWDRALSKEEASWLAAEPYAMLAPASPRRRYFIPRGAATTTQNLAGTLTTAGALIAGALHKRLYFDGTATAAASPAFDGSWTSTTGAVRRRLNHVKGTSTIISGTRIAWVGTAGNKALDRQYVSNPLDGAQAISGTVKCQLFTHQWTDTDLIDQLYLKVFVVSADGGTVRGTLLSLGNHGPVSQFDSASTITDPAPPPIVLSPEFRNKTGADGDAVTLVNALSGDRIVVEIGFGNSTASPSPEASAIYGENAADAAENETTTGVEASEVNTDGVLALAGWIEFSTSLAFHETAQSQTLSGALANAGALIKLVGKIL